MSKLTADDVKLIRAAYASGGISHRALAEKFGVWPRAIAQVINYESWRHV